MVEEFRARRDLVVDGLNAIPGIRCLPPTGAFYVFPDISGTGLTGSQLADRLLNEAGVCVLAGTAFGGVGDEPRPDLVRELAREPHEGARADREFVESLPRPAPTPAGADPMSPDRPKVFVARVDPRRRPPPDHQAATDAASGRTSCRRLGATLLAAIEGCDGVLTLLTDRVDDEFLDRGRAAAEGRLELRGRLRQRRRAGLHAARDPGRQHARRPDRDDRGPRLGAADGRRPARRRGRPLRPRRGSGRPGGRCSCSGPTSMARRSGSSGFGRIGQAVARRAMGFGMTVLYHDVRPRRGGGRGSLGATFLPLDELLPQADFVSLHVNLTRRDAAPDRRRALSWMKPTAVLVNTSRGPVVDRRRARRGAARRDDLRGARSTSRTPSRSRSTTRCVGLDNCLIVPHIASASRATRGKMAEMAAANLLAGVRGERLPTPVNPEVYDRT